jgi:hypothetical protein
MWPLLLPGWVVVWEYAQRKALDMLMSVPSVLVDTAARLTCRVKPVPTTSLWPGPVKSKALLLMQNGFRVSGMTPI